MKGKNKDGGRPSRVGRIEAGRKESRGYRLRQGVGSARQGRG